MDINLLFKIAAIGILVAVLTMVIKEISTLFDTVRTIFNL